MWYIIMKNIRLNVSYHIMIQYDMMYYTEWPSTKFGAVLYNARFDIGLPHELTKAYK